MEQEITGDFTDWTEQLNYYEATMQRKRNPSPEYVDPAAFIRTISELLPEDAVYVADVGQNQIWSCNYHIVKKGHFLTSGGMGTMGYSIPAAMGAKYQCPEKEVVASSIMDIWKEPSPQTTTTCLSGVHIFAPIPAGME